MKRNQVNSILVNQTKRRATVFAYICVIVIVFALAFASFLAYIDRTESQYVNYDETSNIDYQVYYKQNEFFENKTLLNDNANIQSICFTTLVYANQSSKNGEFPFNDEKVHEFFNRFCVHQKLNKRKF